MRPRLFPVRSAWARSAPVRALRVAAQAGLMSPLVRSQVRITVAGREMLDGLRGPMIIVANHASHVDTPALLLALPPAWRHRTVVAAAADYFFESWIRAAPAALFFNAFPLDRKGGAAGGGVADGPGELLAQGWNLIVYPEGTRSADGWMRRFRMGAAYLAVRNGVPVLPVGISGSYAAMPRGRSWPIPGRPPVRVRFGAPITPGPQESVRAFAPRVQAAVAALLDEDASTWWGSLRRAAEGDTPDGRGPQGADWRRRWERPDPAGTGRRQAWRAPGGRR